MEIVPDLNIKQVLSRTSSWKMQFTATWSKFSVDKLNDSIVGMLLEVLFEDSSNEDSIDDLDSCLDFMSDVMFRNNEIKKVLSKNVEESLSNLYKGNIYKTSKLNNMSFSFKYIDDLRLFYPILKIEANVIREKVDVSELVQGEKVKSK